MTSAKIFGLNHHMIVDETFNVCDCVYLMLGHFVTE